MIALTQIRNSEIYVFVAVLVFKLIEPYSFVYKQNRQQKLLKSRLQQALRKQQITLKLQIVGMQNFQDASKTRKRSFISAFSICMTVHLKQIRFELSFSTCCYDSNLELRFQNRSFDSGEKLRFLKRSPNSRNEVSIREMKFRI